ncbi:MAG: RNA polymerase sigma factor [Gammaproteobacteria bacterium]|nr:RNA polymerase sigma factor [Gammaproteobacteria bacterium]
MQEEIVKLAPAVRRFAYSLTGSTHDADDLLQSTVERVLKSPAPEGVELAKWMFRICRNLWVDEYRSRKVRLNAVADPELQESQIVDGERAICGEITIRQVDAAMRQLPDDQRSILSLVALEGLSYKEVASTLDIPAGTVMSRLSRARAALSKILNLNATGVIA